MSDYSEIEKKAGTKVVEVHPKADTEGVYTVLFDKAMNGLIQLVNSRECRKAV